MNYELRTQKTIPLLLILIVLFFVLFALCPSEASAATIGRPANNLGLVGYWDFDVGKGGGVVYDRSGLGNNGTINNATGSVNWTNGTVGQGFEFDGEDDYIEVSGNAGNFGSQYSVSVWVWVDSADSNSQNIPVSNRSGGTNYFGIKPSTERTFWYANGVGTPTLNGVSGALTKGEWHHIVYTRKSSTHRQIFLNSSLDAERTGEDAVSSDTGTLWFGKDPIPNFYHGKLDDVRIYNRALSSGEVERLYKLGQSGGQTIASTKTVVTEGLVGHWTFDGDVTNANTTSDVSGNGNNGTLTNGPTPAIGKLGQALEFDGSDDYVEVSSPGLPTGDFTYSAWLKNISDGEVWFMGSDGSGGNELFMGNTGDDVRVYLDDNFVGPVTNGGVLSGSDWVHIVVTREGGTMKGFADGQESASQSVTSNSLDFSTCPFLIGTDSDSGCTGSLGNYAGGQIDDVRIYNRALTDTEVQRIYNAGASEKINSSRANRLTSGLVGHWTFDGDVTNSNTTSDVSGNGNNGTFTGEPKPVIGKLGQALRFDGVDDYVVIPDPATDLSGDITLAFWVNSEDLDDRPVFISKDFKEEFDIRWQSSIDFFQGDGSSYENLDVGSNSLLNNIWYHLVIVRDGSEARGYINGSLSKTDTVTLSTNDSSNEIYIGARYGGSSKLKGKMDDVRIYDRALSAGEIQELYNLGR